MEVPISMTIIYSSNVYYSFKRITSSQAFLWDSVNNVKFRGMGFFIIAELNEFMSPKSNTEPHLISGPESLVTNPTLRKNEDSDLDNASAAMDLRVIEVKEEVAPSQQLSAAVESAGSTRPKPYICGDCGKSYLWLKNLKKHQKIHTGEAPFSCKICCRLFSSQQVLEEHQRVHTGERPHRCTSCPKTFNHLSNLKKHQLIHTGEKPHHCSLCGKRFRQIQHLKEHRKTHEDSKPFRCWECGWGFNHGSNFKRHLLVHTRQKMRHGLATWAVRRLCCHCCSHCCFLSGSR